MIEDFLSWMDRRLKIGLGFLVVTHLLQIPHFIWGGDAIIKTGLVYDINLASDIFLYSIDLIEIPALIYVCLAFIARMKDRK